MAANSQCVYLRWSEPQAKLWPYLSQPGCGLFFSAHPIATQQANLLPEAQCTVAYIRSVYHMLYGDDLGKEKCNHSL